MSIVFIIWYYLMIRVKERITYLRENMEISI